MAIKRVKVMDVTGDSKKTDPSAMQVCVQCKEMFSEGENRPRSCWHHSNSELFRDDTGKGCLLY